MLKYDIVEYSKPSRPYTFRYCILCILFCFLPYSFIMLDVMEYVRWNMIYIPVKCINSTHK